ncbi:hypothetical protein MKW92_052206 [Papaver armeniacum]|nr:hypothetical protein MKW92_052206 [Papaver armeniacum]
MWRAEVKRDRSLFIRVGKESSLTVRHAVLSERKRGNVAVLYIRPDEANENELALGTLSSDDSPQISLKLKITKDCVLRQSGSYGSIMLYGRKSKTGDSIETVDFDPCSRISTRIPPEKKFKFAAVQNYEFPYSNSISHLSKDDQKKIEVHRWNTIEQFLNTDMEENNKGGLIF